MSVKASEIRNALRRRYAPPECAIAFEVAQSTGFAARRRLDAVAMDLWPSRGLALHGIEIKVSRNDWRKEKANPSKAEEIARFCDLFWIAAPKDLVPDHELPTAWGLLELDGKDLKIKIKATPTPAEAVGREFLAAMLRASSRVLDPEDRDEILARELEKLRAEFDDRVEMNVRARSGAAGRDAEAWRELCKVIDRDAEAWRMSDEEVIRAVNLVLKTGAARSWSAILSLERVLGDALGSVSEALDEMGVERPKPKPKRKKTRK